MDILTLKNSLCKVAQCNNGAVTLVEKDNNATLRKVVLCDVPFGALIVKMDDIKFSNFLKDRKEWGFNKHSDYLIVTNDKLVFIEMKSKGEVGIGLQKECCQKFASDECTITYSDMIFQKMLSKESFFDKRETHFVLLYQAPPITKTAIRAEIELPSNTSPDRFRPIPVANDATISFFRTI